MTNAYADNFVDGFVDGNAMAGPLNEIFAMDVTVAGTQCATCGRTGPVATLRVYTHAPGMVARCPGCDEVVLRLVRGPSGAWLDMRGSVGLYLDLP